MELSPEDRLFALFRRTGDPSALAEVFDRTAAEALRVALHLADSMHDAEDLVQQTFVAAIEDAHRYDPNRRFLPWLLGILAHQARSTRRSRKRRLALAAAHRPGSPE